MESIVVYDRLLTRYPEGKDRESALFGKIIAYAEVEQPKRCQQVCEQYMKEFPEGPNAGTVAYLSGAVALQAQDFVGAETYFGKMLASAPNSQYREEMRYLLGNTRFMQGKFEEALKDYNKYVADYPAGKDIPIVHLTEWNLSAAYPAGKDCPRPGCPLHTLSAAYPAGKPSMPGGYTPDLPIPAQLTRFP